MFPGRLTVNYPGRSARNVNGKTKKAAQAQPVSEIGSPLAVEAPTSDEANKSQTRNEEGIGRGLGHCILDDLTIKAGGRMCAQEVRYIHPHCSKRVAWATEWSTGQTKIAACHSLTSRGVARTSNINALIHAAISQLQVVRYNQMVASVKRFQMRWTEASL